MRFQAVRNPDDLECMSVPDKYKSMQTFHKYYSGQAVAPYPTIFSKSPPNLLPRDLQSLPKFQMSPNILHHAHSWGQPRGQQLPVGAVLWRLGGSTNILSGPCGGRELWWATNRWRVGHIQPCTLQMGNLLPHISH